jgi:hypothetical protein
MDIGEEDKPVRVEPIEDPFRRETPAPQREVPATPTPAPAPVPSPVRTGARVWVSLDA